MVKSDQKQNYLSFSTKFKSKFLIQTVAWQSCKAAKVASLSLFRIIFNDERTVTKTEEDLQNSGSQPFLPRGTLSQLYQNLASLLDAKIGLKVIKSKTGGTPDII